MKIGMRKPSLKKSFSARTTGRVKREIKRAIIPGYGKREWDYYILKKLSIIKCTEEPPSAPNIVTPRIAGSSEDSRTALCAGFFYVASGSLQVI